MHPVRTFRLTEIQPPNRANSTNGPIEFFGEHLDLEIGCGVGWHPIQYAQQNPLRDLIAIEHTRTKFARFRSRFAHHPNLHNLFPIHADAVRWVAHHLPVDSVSRIFILYPNPEPKAPNRRWFRMPFMQQLLKVLKPGGEITLASNEPTYILEAIEYARKHWSLKVLESRSFDSAQPLPGIPRTHFDKKYLQRGQTCFDVRFLKP